jgi:hypothetical protein
MLSRPTDQQLATAMPGADPAAWLAQQPSNDARLRSIQHMDTINLIVSGAAIAAVVASAILTIIPER